MSETTLTIDTDKIDLLDPIYSVTHTYAGQAKLHHMEPQGSLSGVLRTVRRLVLLPDATTIYIISWLHEH